VRTGTAAASAAEIVRRGRAYHAPMASRTRGKRARGAGPAAALSRGVAVSLALGELACSPAAPPPPVQPPPATTAAPVTVATAEPSVTAEPPPPAPPDPSEALAVFTVTDTSYARRVLYTWTSDDQIDELLRTHVLLSRTESPKYGKSYYDRVVEDRWMGGDKIAALLRAPAFLKARFAWPAAWATLLGWPGESYGGQLIEVTLKPDAWIALLRTSAPAWEVRDLSGKIVPNDELLKHPERLAAVHFVHDAVTPPAGTSPSFRASAPDGREAYREYVLCNESMIESWAVGTPRIAEQIRAGADLVDAVAKYFEARPPPALREDRWNVHVALLVWPGLEPATAPQQLYEAAIAFPNPSYKIEPAALRNVSAALRKLQQRAASTTYSPTAKFPGAKPVPVPPPPPPPPPSKIKKWRGTFY
jgi:hypothetical protein